MGDREGQPVSWTDTGRAPRHAKEAQRPPGLPDANTLSHRGRFVAGQHHAQAIAPLCGRAYRRAPPVEEFGEGIGEPCDALPVAHGAGNIALDPLARLL